MHRFLASAVELEDNTDKWDADRLRPASTTPEEGSGSSSSDSTGTGNGNGGSSAGVVVRGHDDDIKERGNDFIARYVQ